ncbi:MAG: sugar porter family MFS transporter [Chlamydiales bacterium]|nr:sugar porter family MFS transporter [Chlamydiales bacterium]
MKSYIIAIIAAIGGFLFGYNTAVMSGAILFIAPEFHLSDLKIEIVIASFLFGAIFGSMLCGKGVGYLGRKKTLILTAFLFLVGALMTFFATNIGPLIAGRVVVGLGIGAASMTAPLYIAELSPHLRRGFFVSFNQVMVTFGICVAYLVNLILAPDMLWRYMLGAAVIPALLLGTGMFFLPESPRWLIKKGKINKAQKILLSIHSKELAHLELEEITLSIQSQKKKVPLFSRKYFIPLLIGISLAAFQQITGINTIIYYAPIIFKMTGMQTDISAIVPTLGIGIVNLLTTLIAIQVIDRLGRRPLLLIGVGGMILSLGVLGIAFYVAAPSPLLGWLTALCLFFYVASFAISLGPIFWLLIAEIYPLSIRGRAMSLATFTNWSANLVVAISFLTLIQLIGQASTFWLYGFISIGCWFFIFFLVPETKGRTLEEIERFWNRKKR